jgi:hypothetical protein
MHDRCDPSGDARASRQQFADQAWFWSETWRKMEREVDDRGARAAVEVFDYADSFLATLGR